MAGPDHRVTLAQIDYSEERKAERLARITEAGRKIAAALRADPKLFQEQAANAAGLSRKTYYQWLDGDGPEYQEFQRTVNAAVYEQAQSAENDAERAIGSCENGSGAWASWHKWKLEKRYRKIYGDLAQAPTKIALTDSEGNDLAQVPTAQLVAMLAQTKQGDGE